MNKGYAFGFLVVLLVLILGLYVAYTGFVSSRETLGSQPTSTASTRVVQALPSSIRLSPTVTATMVVTLTAAPEVTTTVAATSLPMPPESSPAATQSGPTPTGPPPTDSPAPALTEPPPAEATAPLTPALQPPTPVPAPAHQFRLAGPPAPDPGYPICCYIFGTVRDAAGSGLEGIQVQVSNEWNPPTVAVTKGGDETGKYDIPINTSVVNWEIVLVDAAGNQISTKVQIQFDAKVAQGYRVDWQRVY